MERIKLLTLLLAMVTLGCTRHDDPALPALSINDVTVTEGAPAMFEISATHASTDTMYFSYRTANRTATSDADYTAIDTKRIAYIAPGMTATTLTVPTRFDNDAEPTETFRILLDDATHATLADNEGTASILNIAQQLPELSITHQTVDEGEKVNLTVSLSKVLTNPLSVYYSTTDGTATPPDYVAITTPQLLTIPPGKNSATITVWARSDDATAEPDETFNVIISLAQNDPVIVTNSQAVVTIKNVAQRYFMTATLNSTPWTVLTDGAYYDLVYNSIVAVSNDFKTTIRLDFNEPPRVKEYFAGDYWNTDADKIRCTYQVLGTSANVDYTCTQNSGKVTITAVDAVKRTITGTFYFTGTDVATGNTVSVTDGAFYLPFGE